MEKITCPSQKMSSFVESVFGKVPVCVCARFLRWSTLCRWWRGGNHKVLLQTNGEPAIGCLAEAVKDKGGSEQAETVVRTGPRYSSGRSSEDGHGARPVWSGLTKHRSSRG
eukprot:282570-Amphidinium_carterae.1